MRFGKRVEASSWVIDGQKRACIRGRLRDPFPAKHDQTKRGNPHFCLERASDFIKPRTCVGMFSSLSTLSILSHHGQRRWCRESARAR